MPLDGMQTQCSSDAPRFGKHALAHSLTLSYILLQVVVVVSVRRRRDRGAAKRMCNGFFSFFGIIHYSPSSWSHAPRPHAHTRPTLPQRCCSYATPPSLPPSQNPAWQRRTLARGRGEISHCRAPRRPQHREAAHCHRHRRCSQGCCCRFRAVAGQDPQQLVWTKCRVVDRPVVRAAQGLPAPPARPRPRPRPAAAACHRSIPQLDAALHTRPHTRCSLHSARPASAVQRRTASVRLCALAQGSSKVGCCRRRCHR